jgi:uncharacterized protein with HEPN domain
VPDLLDACNQIRTFTKGMTLDGFVADEKTQMAVRMALTIIGEVVANMPDEVKDANPDVPWRKIRDLRSLLVHVYWQVDPRILWDIVVHHVPLLEARVRTFVDESAGDH